MTEPKNPFERAVELFFYAPVGLAVTARELVPALVERGRRQVDPQVGVAHTIGQLAVAQGRSSAEKAVERALAQGRSQAEKAVAQALTQVQATLQQLGVLPDGAVAHDVVTDEAPPNDAPPNDARQKLDVEPSAPVRHRDGPTAVTLAIPDYDSLSASQVVPRLSSLSESELEAVRIYESDHRGRKTILNKIAQLRAT
ncbi:MAG: hypothetical protein ACR2K0_07780 [Acidimicrobiales bacterium]